MGCRLREMGKLQLTFISALALALGFVFVVANAEVAEARQGTRKASVRKSAQRKVAPRRPASSSSQVGRSSRRSVSAGKPTNSRRQAAKSPSRQPSGAFVGSSAGSGERKPLKVQGQSRNLSMMLVLKGEKDKIRFGDIRENYKREILNTNF